MRKFQAKLWLGMAALFALGVIGLLIGSASTSQASATDPVIAAAGDICGSSTDCAPTASLLDAINPDAVLTLGDNAYQDGTLTEYTTEYGPNWGRQNAKVYPASGNHDFQTANAQGYRDYFGTRVPAQYYSYDLGSWHLISLASRAGISPSSGSAEEAWLRADLAAHPSQCILAYWHEPRFSSGTVHGSDSTWATVWNDLYAAGADVVLNGHEHNYERFAKQTPSAVASATGIREFVSGTGGANGSSYPFGAPIANSEVRADAYGVLKLTLHPGGYDWQFVPVAGQTFTDSGSDTCSGAAPPPTTSTTTSSSTSTTTTTVPTTTTTPADTTPPSVPTNLRITTSRKTAFTIAWDASTDNVGVTGYRVWKDGVLIATTTSTAYTNTGKTCGRLQSTFTVEVAAVDAAGNVSSRASLTTPC